MMLVLSGLVMHLLVLGRLVVHLLGRDVVLGLVVHLLGSTGIWCLSWEAWWYICWAGIWRWSWEAWSMVHLLGRSWHAWW